MSDDVPMTSLCSHPAINFNGNGVVDEHIVTSFANVLVRLWIPTLLCHYFVTACSPFFATWRNSVCPKQPPSLLCRMLLRVHCPSSGLSRLDGWGLCGLRVFWGWGDCLVRRLPCAPWLSERPSSERRQVHKHHHKFRQRQQHHNRHQPENQGEQGVGGGWRVLGVG